MLRIVYLPFRAMAEPTRMLLALGSVPYEDEAVWGSAFQQYKQQQLFPFGKTPVMVIPSTTLECTLTMADSANGGIVVAQSGALARHAAKLAGRFPTEDHTACAVSDAIFELGQEMCTINPLVNCYTGDYFDQIKRHYFRDVAPVVLPQLERQLTTVGRTLALQQEEEEQQQGDGGVFFAGNRASYGDINVFHMLNNAVLLEPDLLSVETPALEEWYWRVAALDGLQEYLEKRPTLNGVAEDPGWEDRRGVRITQRTSPGRAWLVDGCWQLDPLV